MDEDGRLLRDSQGRPLLIDIDGFFKPIVEAEGATRRPPDYQAMLPRSRAEVHRICQVHFLFRSAINLLPESGPFENYQDFSRIMLLRAIEHCSDDSSSVLKIPDWADFICDSVKRVHGEEYPVLHDVSLHVELEPRLYAWSIPRKREVHVSAVTRELLLRINILLVNASSYLSPAKLDRDPDLEEEASSYLLSYLSTSFYDLNYSRLPVARAVSREAFHLAMLVTQTQFEFMISHEFGHVADEMRDIPLLERENKCDRFAFDVLSEAESPSHVFTALRWLFIVVSLERLLGEILYKASDTWSTDIDWIQEEVRSRDFSEQILAAHPPEDVLGWMEAAGSFLLFSVKAHLREIGPAGVRRIVADAKEHAALPSVAEFERFVLDALATLMANRSLKESDDAY